jgi:uncharacterized damage-inducible protein DinB
MTRKVEGLSEEDLHRRLVPSATTMGGLLKHLCRVESSWFQHRIAGIPADDLPLVKKLYEDPDSDFRLEPGDTAERLIERYEAQCALSREAAAPYDLDHVVPHQVLGTVSARWIFIHMIEETARHAGHADILREQIDGATGD